MNLYDLMGPVAVAGGIGASYGAVQEHGPTFWGSLVAGAIIGVATFLAFRRLMSRAPERALPAHYIGMPICVLAATIAASWLVRASL